MSLPTHLYYPHKRFHPDDYLCLAFTRRIHFHNSRGEYTTGSIADSSECVHQCFHGWELRRRTERRSEDDTDAGTVSPRSGRKSVVWICICGGDGRIEQFVLGFEGEIGEEV